MKVSTKKSLERNFINLAVITITFLIVNLIIRDSFSDIEWDVLFVMYLAFFITSLMRSYKE
ncbi:hypothetical protein DP73_03140 [Desulfosporosinus sp. HMP52]|nr:hypothetical protein DP73_03140 [Desulfosporosinus sp. HMP52]